MKKQILIIVLCLFAFVPCEVFAARALKVCMNNTTGAIKARKRCTKKETMLTGEVLGSMSTGPQGPAGPKGDPGPQGLTGQQGPQGPAGGVDVSSCFAEQKNGPVCDEGNWCTTRIECGDAHAVNGSKINDLVISWSFDTGNDGYLLNTSQILKGNYPNSYPSGMKIWTTSRSDAGAHTPVLTIVCCSPN